ncbi:MAG TPA: prolyl oligopeptidase family serine peptidase [Flavobacteriales bacterium]
MRTFITLAAATLLLAACNDTTTSKKEVPPRMKITKYPETKKIDAKNEYFGTIVEDPYQWLENDTSAETAAWVDAQIAVTRSYLDSIPFRNKLAERFKELYNFEKVGAPIKAGDYYFIYKNSGLEPQGKYFVRKGLDGEDELFLDINTIAEGGLASASLLGADDDNRYMAVSINEAGSDWSRIEVYDIATKKKLDDVLQWVKFSGAAWYGDGFFYSRYPEPAKGTELSGDNKHHQVYYHKIGTPQSEDELVYADPARPDLYHNVYLTEDKKYLFLVAAPGTDTYEVWYKNPADKAAKFIPLFIDPKYHTAPVHCLEDGTLLVLTDVDAPNYRLVKVNPKNPDPANWQDVIPHGENLLQGVSTCGGKLFATYLDKANTRIFQLNFDGSDKKEISLPDKTGSAGGFSGKKEDKFCFYSFTSFTYPSVIFKYDIETGESSEFSKLQVKFNPSDYESKQVMYKSKDGTDVPMFIVHKKGIQLDGNNPTLLYSYGGFAIPMQPGFSASRIMLLENGGVFAMPCIRGGNEFGEEWHKAGMLNKKQNVFDDFIAAAQYLIDQGYTSKEKLAIEGGSNGGLLVGACMTQRPDLFKVAFPAVGVLDMLRFHKFTVGKGWIPEYGCAENSKEEFDYLYKYSPYHNLKDGTNYPATLVITADHDDRVVPAHSFKFAARLQEYHKGDNPVLIRIEKSAGHGAGKSTDQIINEIADKYAFFFYNLGVDL